MLIHGILVCGMMMCERDDREGVGCGIKDPVTHTYEEGEGGEDTRYSIVT